MPSYEEMGKQLLAAFDECERDEYMFWWDESRTKEGFGVVGENPQTADISEGTLSVCLDGNFDFVAIAKNYENRIKAVTNA